MSTWKPRSKQSDRADSDESDYQEQLSGDWWDAVERAPEVQNILASCRKNRPPRESSGAGQNPTTRRVLSKQLSEPVITTEQVVVARGSMMSNSLFPIRRAGDSHLGLPPVTPTKPKLKVLQNPPSTGRTTIANVLHDLNLGSPYSMLAPKMLEFYNKFLLGLEGNKGKVPSHPSPDGHTKQQPSRAILIELEDDDDDEEEVTELLTKTDSSPSTRAASLFDNQLSQNTRPTNTPASSWSTNATRVEGSFSGVEEPLGNRKRPWTSDGTNPTNEVLATSHHDKARKGQRGDSPNKSMSPPRPLVPKPTQPTPISISSFFQGKLETGIQPILIAHSAETQKLMDKLGLCWGVQYELARGVTTKQWTWDGVYNVLSKKPGVLKGSNAQVAFKVRAAMQDRDVSRNFNVKLWEELDREQEAILENKGRGLGLMGEWHGRDNWYGGCIQQIARLVKRTNGTGFDIELEPMEKRRSHRFSRFCGSRRILQLRISKDLLQKENKRVKSFLKGRFVLCGRLFVPFHAKDHCLYMMETNEDWERQPLDEFGDQHRISFADFISWHNPLEYNHQQALSKYVTRFALGLSTTIPVLEFEAENMHYIEDIYGNEYRGGKASAEETMTDGCGLINQAALVKINEQLNKPSLPVALQGRIAGAKGIWLLHPTDKNPVPTIWIRDSQNKIKLPNPARSQRIFELVATSYPPGSASISRQFIVNLSFNGVPDEVLLAHLEKGLAKEIEPLVQWDHPKANLHLWHSIETAGNVSRSRLGRATAGISRALGLTRRAWGEQEDADSAVDFDEDKSVETGRNEYSGEPFGLHESALELVQAGFHPSTFKPLRDKLKCILEQAVKSYVENYRIPLLESLEAFVVPDPLGILEEGEIYYRSSQSLLNPRTQRTFDVLTGDVILGRYPIRVASDIQKVKAVNQPELYPWPDVIVASTKGSRSLASLLSGGDMDGDELFVLYEPELVGPFQNKPFVMGPSDLLEKNFQKDVETVAEFCERAKSMDLTRRQAGLQEALLLSLNADQKGLYSVFHENAIERYGYDHTETVRLAYVFNTLLDASKSGLILVEGVFEQDRKEYGSGYKDADDSLFGDPDLLKREAAPPTTNPESDAFILTKLQRRAKEKGADFLTRFSQASESGLKCDPDLAKPYTTANNFAFAMHSEHGMKLFVEELSKIRAHISAAHNEWLKEVSLKKSSSRKSKKPSKKADSGSTKKAAMLFAAPIEGIVATRNVEEIKASFAYSEWRNSPFAFSVAFKHLCEIKAREARGGMAPCTREIDEMKTIRASCIRAVEKSYD